MIRPFIESRRRRLTCPVSRTTYSSPSHPLWGVALRALAPAIKPSLVFAILGVLTVLVWRAAASSPDGRLHMSVLDVVSGEAVILRTALAVTALEIGL